MLPLDATPEALAEMDWNVLLTPCTVALVNLSWVTPNLTRKTLVIDYSDRRPCSWRSKCVLLGGSGEIATQAQQVSLLGARIWRSFIVFFIISEKQKKDNNFSKASSKTVCKYPNSAVITSCILKFSVLDEFQPAGDDVFINQCS